MPTGIQLANRLITQKGDPYTFGAEIPAGTPDPVTGDCSEYIEWDCNIMGVVPRMPDGTWNQVTHCRNHGKLVSVAYAIQTKGALLFRFSSSPFEGSRPRTAHVAMSLGNGMTIEARGRAYGVGSWSAIGRGWTHAALIPGVNYSGVLSEDEMTTSLDDFIKARQRALKEAGFYTGQIDGDWGPKSQAADLKSLEYVGLPDTVKITGTVSLEE